MHPKGGIAFFDSGIGGLTTLYACVNYAQKSNFAPINYYYYGDNTRAPYGNLSEKQIFSYVEEIFSRFQALEVSAVVIACNTVTAVCAEKLREKYAFPIIGIEPSIFPAMREGGEVFVLATCATCNSQKFQNLCARAKSHYPSAKLRVFPCENLAGIIEKNLGNESMDYSTFLPKGNPTRVVLGCTHYIYIRKQIEEFYACPTVDSNQAVARRLFELISRQEKGLSVVGNALDKNECEIIQNTPFSWKTWHENLSNIKIQANFEDNVIKKSPFERVDREEKPLFCEIATKSLKNQPLVTPTKNLTKCSRIYFLGEAKMVNKTKYEQMFTEK